jgi:hypothetical protein
MNPKQFAGDINKRTRTSSTLDVDAPARIMLWLLLANDLATGKRTVAARRAPRASFYRWESINYPRVSIPFESAYSSLRLPNE